MFGFTAEETGANLPSRFAPWAFFKSVELNRGESRPVVDSEDCLDDIEKYVFHVTDAHVRITEMVS